MADKEIVEKAKAKLSEEEYLHLKDWIHQQRRYKERKDYTKGYNAGFKKASHNNPCKEEK